MPRDHIANVVERAKQSLNEWLTRQNRFCDLKRAHFNQDAFPYNERHMQAFYLLHYYPAYFAENYLLFEALRTDGLNDPIIESIGCGCMVDLAAAQHVYDGPVAYTGYDITEWHIKAVEAYGNDAELRIGNIAEEHSFDENSNVFHFSRSIGDLQGLLPDLGRLVAATALEEDTIYISATYRASAYSIAGDMRNLRAFAGHFHNFNIVDEDLFYPGGENPPRRCGINAECPWFYHPETNYCRTLPDRCPQPEPDCPDADCERYIGGFPILRLENLAFEILKLRRRE